MVEIKSFFPKIIKNFGDEPQLNSIVINKNNKKILCNFSMTIPNFTPQNSDTIRKVKFRDEANDCDGMVTFNYSMNGSDGSPAKLLGVLGENCPFTLFPHATGDVDIVIPDGEDCKYFYQIREGTDILTPKVGNYSGAIDENTFIPSESDPTKLLIRFPIVPSYKVVTMCTDSFYNYNSETKAAYDTFHTSLGNWTNYDNTSLICSELFTANLFSVALSRNSTKRSDWLSYSSPKEPGQVADVNYFFDDITAENDQFYYGIIEWDNDNGIFREVWLPVEN